MQTGSTARQFDSDLRSLILHEKRPIFGASMRPEVDQRYSPVRRIRLRFLNTCALGEWPI